MIRRSYRRSGAATLFAICVANGACSAPTRPSVYRMSDDVTGVDAESVEPFDGGLPDRDSPRDGGPTLAGQPLTLLADMSVGMAEIIEVSLRDDGLMVACGSRGGLVVADGRDPAAPRLYPPMQTGSGGSSHFRCTHVALAGTTAYVTFRADSTMPSYLAAVELSDAPAVVATYPAPAGQVFESALTIGGRVVVAMHRDGLGVFERTGGSFAQRAALGGLTNAHGLALAGTTLYVADGEGGLATVDVSDPSAPRLVGRVATGGIAQTVTVDAARHTAYVSAGSAGVVVVDVTRPEAPTLAGRVAIGGVVGQLAIEGGRLYVAAWRDVRVYSLDDPRRPTLVGIVRPTHADQTARVMGVAARDDLVVIADWNHLQTWRFRPGYAAPYLETSPGTLALGRAAVGDTVEAFLVVENLGRATLAGLTAQTVNPAFTVTPATLDLAPGESRELRVSYRATDPTPHRALLDLQSPDPDANSVTVELLANAAFLSAGDPAPDETAQLTNGSQWRLADQRGHVVLLSYFTSWCPVCGLHMPDIEANVWQRYRARGLVVVGIDPPLAAIRAPDAIDDVAAFARHAGITFPLGVSTTATYDTLRMGRSDESAPFPVMLLVDPAGRVSYVGTTLNPAALSDAIERALAVTP